MARIEFPEEVRKRVEAIGAADLVLGIAGAIHPEELRTKIAESMRALIPAPAKTVVVYAGTYAGPDEAGGSEPAVDGIEFLAYPLPQHDPSLGPWVEVSVAQRTVLALAALLQARACAVLHCDFATLNDSTLRLLVPPILEGKCDLVTPIYPEGKYEGLINKSLLAPLSRALFSRRVRSPLPFDFCASARVIPKLADPGSQQSQPGSQLLWPSNVVAVDGAKIWQAYINVTHTLNTEGLELSAVLAQLAGALFQEVEATAAQWQRVRGSQSTEISGVPPEHKAGGEPVDARTSGARPLDVHPMIDSFILGFRNLEEVWRLVLPPVAVFDLQRLTRLPPEQFRMTDELWARIVYDFALAYRLRRIGRTHLLGALTPLYLGWVASYALEVGDATIAEADARVEMLARAFEENKSYFVSRWRWPDRTS
jgi:glucosylglycerate synthase